jgi:two-component system sensor histidine kinase DesK
MTTTSEGAAPQGTVPSEPHPRLREGQQGPGRFGWAFAGIWLFYLLDPLRHAWQVRDVALPWRLAATVALLVFAAGFLWFFVWWRGRRVNHGSPPRPGEVIRVLGIGVLLLVVAAPAGGQNVLNGFVYIGAAAAMTLPLRFAMVVVLLLIGAVFGVPRGVPGWAAEDAFIPELLLGCAAAFGVGKVIERNAQLAQAREQLVDLAVTQERERMGRDVHDILGHSLTVITVKTELAGRLLESVAADPAIDRVRAEVADVERLAREALADVRATVSGTRGVSLTGELAAARSALAAAGIRAELPGAVDVVPARHRELFAWALREGVTNVVRHSGGIWCGVQLTADCVEVRDDGRGPGGCGTGNGLAGLQARAEKAGGRLEVERAPEGGFLLRVLAGGSPA